MTRNYFKQVEIQLSEMDEPVTYEVDYTAEQIECGCGRGLLFEITRIEDEDGNNCRDLLPEEALEIIKQAL